MAEPISIDQARDEFKAKLEEYGLIIKGSPIADGKIHRVPVQGAKNPRINTSGAYTFHVDTPPSGWIKNYKTGDECSWTASGRTEELTADQRRALHQKIVDDQRQEVIETANRQKAISEWATETWNSAQQVDSHPYLQAKDVHASEIRVDGQNRLLVPMRDIDGGIWNLQRIAENGEKRFAAGGRINGLFCALGEPDHTKPWCFVEGYATGETVRNITGLPTIVTFNSGNLEPVVESLRGRYPSQQFIIAGDNDHHLPLRESGAGRPLPNTGLVAATSVAKKYSADVLIPSFRGPEDPGTDWNDYASQHGPEAVRDAFQSLLIKQSNERVAPDALWRDAQHAAIEKVTSLGGDIARNQKLLTVAFDTMRLRGAGSLEHCWSRAAEAVVDRIAKEREQEMNEINPGQQEEVREQSPKQPGPQVDQPEQIQPDVARAAADEHAAENVIGEREATPLVAAAPPQEKLTREQVASALAKFGSLENKDLSGLDLSGLVFYRANLSGTNLAHTINTGTVYDSCYSPAANFCSASFENAEIRNNNFTASLWNAARMVNTNVTDNNAFDCAEMRNLTVASREQERTQSGPPAPAPTAQAERLARRMESRDDSLLSHIKRDLTGLAERARCVLTGTPTAGQTEKMIANHAAAKRDALIAAGWDGTVEGNASHTKASAVVNAQFVALARSGKYSAFQVEEGVDLYTEIVARERQALATRPALPQVSGNSFRNADLTGAKFINVDFKDNNLDGAHLQNCLVNGHAPAVAKQMDVASQLEMDTKLAAQAEREPQAERRRDNEPEIARPANVRESRTRGR
jgi:phage/plasmid primase-like uncharacterized protein/uncharacterized protein YjbI with pentapeptide repeats